jgi:hypothetical protein
LKSWSHESGGKVGNFETLTPQAKAAGC